MFPAQELGIFIVLKVCYTTFLYPYEISGWDGNPPPKSLRDNPSMRNYRRVIETWWDDWSKFFYVARPEAKTLDFGDISPQVEFRKNHCPYDFNWFMKGNIQKNSRK